MSKSKKWRNGKKSHTLSPEEKLQRDWLKQQHLEKQRIQKRDERIGFMKVAIPIAILGALFIGSMIVDFIFNSDFFFYYCMTLWLIGIIVFDKSGLRCLIFKYYPDKFPFSAILKENDPPARRIVEVCKTASLLSVFLTIIIGNWSFVLTSIWIICVFIIFCYILFDEKTPLISETGDLTSVSIFILIIQFLLIIIGGGNISINKRLFLFILAFTMIVLLIYIFRAKKLLLNALSAKSLAILVIGSITFSYAAFVRINEDFDFKKPNEYIVTVDDKHIYGGKHRDHTIEVVIPDDKNSEYNISISSDVYREINIGDEVIICKSNGALGMEYYYFKEKVDSE